MPDDLLSTLPNSQTTPLGSSSNVVLIDDDLAMAAMLSAYLKVEGFLVQHASTAVDGLRLALKPDTCLVLLDVVLPDGDGFSLLRDLRKSSSVPVIMLTIQTEVQQRVIGLESGADDYVPKPFSPVEVVARMRSVLRRQRLEDKDDDVRSVGDLSLTASARSVSQETRVILCTTSEYELLSALLKTPGEAVSREDLTRAALGRSSYAGDRGVDNLVHALRRKLGARPDGGERFKAVRNLGYVYLTAGSGRPEEKV